MSPAAGTEWLTATGVTQRSETRCSTSSIKDRNFTTGTSGWGILLKSGQSALLKTLERSAVITGSMLLIVTAAPTSQNASVSVR